GRECSDHLRRIFGHFENQRHRTRRITLLAHTAAMLLLSIFLAPTAPTNDFREDWCGTDELALGFCNNTGSGIDIGGSQTTPGDPGHHYSHPDDYVPPVGPPPPDPFV